MAAPGGLDQQDRGQDAAIKLFGRSIPVLHPSVVAATASEVSSRSPSSRNHCLTRDGWGSILSWSTVSLSHLAGGGQDGHCRPFLGEKGGGRESGIGCAFSLPLLLRCQMRVGGSWFLLGFRSLFAAKRFFLFEPCLIPCLTLTKNKGL